jgi:hypothetical protein
MKNKGKKLLKYNLKLKIKESKPTKAKKDARE